MSESKTVDWRITGEPDDDLEISPTGMIYDWDASPTPIVARPACADPRSWLMCEAPQTAEKIRKIAKLMGQFVAYEKAKGGS